MYTENEANLAGKLVVVAGATGNVGEGIVCSLLRRGARVAALSRSEAKLAELKAKHADIETGEFIGVAGDTSSFDGAWALAQWVRERHGPVHHCVAGLGKWWQGKPVWEVSETEFDQTFVNTSRIHFANARAFTPVLEVGGSYTFLAGLAYVLPIPNVSLIGMGGGAQLMLSRELQADVGDRVRINSLILGYIISRSRPTGQSDWLTAEEVGDLVARLALSDVKGQSLRADDRSVANTSFQAVGA